MRSQFTEFFTFHRIFPARTNLTRFNYLHFWEWAISQSQMWKKDNKKLDKQFVAVVIFSVPDFVSAYFLRLKLYGTIPKSTQSERCFYQNRGINFSEPIGTGSIHGLKLFFLKRSNFQSIEHIVFDELLVGFTFSHSTTCKNIAYQSLKSMRKLMKCKTDKIKHVSGCMVHFKNKVMQLWPTKLCSRLIWQRFDSWGKNVHRSLFVSRCKFGVR